MCDQGDGIGVGEKGIAPRQRERNCGWKVGGGGGRMLVWEIAACALAPLVGACLGARLVARDG